MTPQSNSTIESIYQVPVSLIDLDSVSTFDTDRNSNIPDSYNKLPRLSKTHDNKSLYLKNDNVQSHEKYLDVLTHQHHVKGAYKECLTTFGFLGFLGLSSLWGVISVLFPSVYDTKTRMSSMLYNDHVKSIDLRSLLHNEIVSNDNQIKKLNQKYQTRIQELHGYAILEGFNIKKSSQKDFWSFIKSTRYMRKASLFLMDNGNLRTVWRDSYGNHIGLQFLGNGRGEYVIFKRRSSNKDVARVAGIDILDGIKIQIRSFNFNMMEDV